jgi:hypothetical protein
MHVARVETGVYPSTLPTSIKLSDKVGIALTSFDGDGFCVNVTYKTLNDIYYSIDDNGVPNAALCVGSVVDTLGDYNYLAGGASAPDPTTMPSFGKSVAPGDMGFTVQTNDTWSSITLSWNAMPDATYYRVCTRTSPTDTWYARHVTDGSSNAGCSSTSTYNPAYTNKMSPTTTSMTWASTSAIPQNADQTFGYEIQYQKADGSWSDWQSTTLSIMDGRTIPAVKNFKVIPSADWKSLSFSWDGIGNFANLPGVYFRLCTRTSPTDTWYTRYVTDGSSNSGCSSTSTYNPAYTNKMSPTTTSLSDWTNSVVIPQNVTQTYEYKIQLWSGSATSDWTTTTLNPLQYVGLSQLPSITGFTVVPSGDWTGLSLSWDSIGALANLPGINIRLCTRTSPTDTWYARYVTDGSSNAGCSSTSTYNPAYTNKISPTATSISWPSTTAIPQSAGQTYGYEIQMWSGSATGSWATTSITR